MARRRIRVMQVGSTIWDFIFGEKPHNAGTLIIGSGAGTLTVNTGISQAALDALLKEAASYCAISAITIVYKDLK